MVAVEEAILEKLGVVGPVGDLREDVEDIDWISAREGEFLREAEVVELDLSLREKKPIFVELNEVSLRRTVPFVGGVSIIMRLSFALCLSTAIIRYRAFGMCYQTDDVSDADSDRQAWSPIIGEVLR
jgi:hypothetical protein